MLGTGAAVIAIATAPTKFRAALPALLHPLIESLFGTWVRATSRTDPALSYVGFDRGDFIDRGPAQLEGPIPDLPVFLKSDRRPYH
jgi:hypothetical protein